MKRDIFLCFVVMIGLFLIPPEIGGVWKRHSVVDVEGKVSRLYDLCDFAYRMDVENFNEDDPIVDVYLGDIVGMNVETWESLEVEDETPVYVFDSDNYALPYKLAGRDRPVVYHYEIYEMDGLYYLKVVYLVSHKSDKVKEYISHYRYTNLSGEAIEAMNDMGVRWTP